MAPAKGFSSGAAGPGFKRRAGQSPAVSLADFVAECAIRCGLTISEAVDHSPGQLRLLADAASRVDASGGLLSLHTTYAATIATQVKEGRSVMERLQKKLLKQAKGQKDG